MSTRKTIRIVEVGPDPRTRIGDPFLSIAGISVLLDCSQAAVRRLIRTGKLREVEIEGIGRRVPFADVFALVKGRAREEKRS